jgi:hypothetical protein
MTDDALPPSGGERMTDDALPQTYQAPYAAEETV